VADSVIVNVIMKIVFNALRNTSFCWTPSAVTYVTASCDHDGDEDRIPALVHVAPNAKVDIRPIRSPIPVRYPDLNDSVKLSSEGHQRIFREGESRTLFPSD
jgi:hypothetical protein